MAKRYMIDQRRFLCLFFTHPADLHKPHQKQKNSKIIFAGYRNRKRSCYHNVSSQCNQGYYLLLCHSNRVEHQKEPLLLCAHVSAIWKHSCAPPLHTHNKKTMRGENLPALGVLRQKRRDDSQSVLTVWLPTTTVIKRANESRGVQEGFEAAAMEPYGTRCSHSLPRTPHSSLSFLAFLYSCPPPCGCHPLLLSGHYLIIPPFLRCLAWARILDRMRLEGFGMLKVTTYCSSLCCSVLH